MNKLIKKIFSKSIITSKNIKITPIFIFLLVIYSMYIYYYYGVINFDSIIKHTVGSINLFCNDIKYLMNYIFADSKSLNTLIFTVGIFCIIRFTNINFLLKDVNYFEAPNIKFGINKDIQDSSEDNVEIKDIEPINSQIFSSNINSDIKEDMLINSNIREDILKILIDNQEIIEIIELFINNPRDVIIPGNLIPSRYKMECIDKLFYWKMKPGAIKLIGIKKDIAPYLIDTYQELKNQGFIYVISQ